MGLVELDLPSLGALGHGCSGGVVDRPPSLDVVEDDDRVEPEDPAQPFEQGRHRRCAGEAGECLGLGAGPRAVRRAPGGEGDEGAHDRRHGEEDRQREQVLALRDRERVERRREVPVDEEEAGHGCRERGPDAADGGDDDDQQEEEQEDAREAEMGAEVREHPGQERQRDGREQEAEANAPPREGAGSAGPRRRGGGLRRPRG